MYDSCMRGRKMIVICVVVVLQSKIGQRVLRILGFFKASKIKSSHQPSTTTCSPLICVLKYPIDMFFLNDSRVGDPSVTLSSLFQCLIALSMKKVFLISKLVVL